MSSSSLFPSRITVAIMSPIAGASLKPWPLLPALSCDVFLSAEPSQVLKAREQGVAAALILPGARLADEAMLWAAILAEAFEEDGADGPGASHTDRAVVRR